MLNKIIVSILTGFIIVDFLLIFIALSISPIKLKRNSFTYEYGETISTDIAHYVNANPTVIKNTKLDLTAVSNEVGVYVASIEYKGEIQKFEIKVVDTVNPKFQLKKVQVNIQLGQTLKACDLIEKVEDLSKTTVYFYDEDTKQKKEEMSFTQEGSYVERIVVEDAHGNQSAALRVKIVVEVNHVPPTIKGADDIKIKVGQKIDLHKDVRAEDDIEGDITSRLKIEGKVDNQKVGTYQIVYSVSDKEGNIAKVVRKVIVSKK